jgi:diguanylate cyclase (GGDEF)-like protein
MDGGPGIREDERIHGLVDSGTLSLTDELTKLPNRRAWNDGLGKELRRAMRTGDEVCVVILDLDRFKQVNDRDGHAEGDRLLRMVAEAWSAVVRPYDLLARHGGDEFSLILSGVDRDVAATIVDRLHAAMPDGHTFSAGIAQWDRAEAADELVTRADAALYEAKQAGRDCAVAV